MRYFPFFIIREGFEVDALQTGFMDFFKTVPDHRIERRKRYPVEEILFLTLCGLLAGCEGWNDIEFYGRTKLKYLKRYFPFKSGIPSDDTLRRFFRALDPKKFEDCFFQWVKSFQSDLTNKIIAIDGKTCCGSFDTDSRPLHLVSAFVSETGISLGQVKVDDKTNEIKAVPVLLDMLDLTGATVTIDAMGCQVDIAEKVLEKGANYIFSLKGNQGSLHESVQKFFERKLPKIKRKRFTKENSGHGRHEKRKCTVVDDIEWLRERHPRWNTVKSIVEIESTRQEGDKVTEEKRYYVTSHSSDPKKLLSAVRMHWGIENRLHWVLDVCFGEDDSRIRKGNAPQNIALVKKAALNMMQIAKAAHPRVSFKMMRKAVGWDNQFLDCLLKGHF